MPPQRRGAFYGRDIAGTRKPSRMRTQRARCVWCAIRQTRQGGERGATGRGARRDREGSAARHLMARALRGGILSVRAGVQACVCVRAQVWARVRAGVQGARRCARTYKKIENTQN